MTQKIAFYQAEILTDKDEKSAQIVHFLPSLESHLRPLIDNLKTDSERIAVWKNVVFDSSGNEIKITAALVQKKVDEFLASGEIVEDVDYEINHTVNLSTGAKTKEGKAISAQNAFKGGWRQEFKELAAMLKEQKDAMKLIR